MVSYFVPEAVLSILVKKVTLKKLIFSDLRVTLLLSK